MTKNEALQIVDTELGLLEDREQTAGVQLFCVKDTGEEIICLFNDPRVPTIVVEYGDYPRMGLVDNDFGS